MKRILLSAATSWIGRVLAIVINLVGIPIAYGALGEVRFGLLLIVLSIGSWIGIANVGFGRAVTVVVARYIQKSRHFVAYTVTTAAAVSAVINAGLVVLCSVIVVLLVHFRYVNEDIAAHLPEFIGSTIILFVVFAVWFSLAIFEGIDAGQEQLYRLYAFHTLSYVITFALLLTVFRVAPSLPLATYLLGASFLLGSVLHACDVVRRYPDLFVRLGRRRRRLERTLVGSAIDFTIISFALAMLYQLVVGIFGLYIGPEQIIDLGIFMRIMLSLLALIFALTYPMSSAITASLARSDRAAAIHSARWSGVIVISFFAACSAAFYWFGEPLISLWLRRAVHYDLPFRAAATGLIFLSAVHAYLAAILIGVGEIRAVSRLHALEGLVVLPTCYLFYTLLGQGGILLGIDLVLLVLGIFRFAARAIRTLSVRTFMRAVLLPT
jgi:O-antigen/teichoic acid export membrane protein